MVENAWIIDDDDVYSYGFSKFVANKSLCKNLIAFNNSIDAINTLTNHTDSSTLPDVIFISVDLKDNNCWKFMTAFETLTSTRSFKKIAIYLLTSSINYLDIERSKNYPAITDYMIKPVDAQHFTYAFDNDILSKSA